MIDKDSPVVSRKTLYFSMVVLLIAIFVGAINDAPPVYLAVGFIGEIILVSTAHLSTIIQETMATHPKSAP